MGVLRYDLAGSRAEVSLYLFQGRAGLGWGRALLARGEVAVGEHWPQVTVIDAQVLPDNPASIDCSVTAAMSSRSAVSSVW